MVSVYSEDGHVENLADLQQGRHYHACTSYVSNNGTRVSFHDGMGQYGVGLCLLLVNTMHIYFYEYLCLDVSSGWWFNRCY